MKRETYHLANCNRCANRNCKGIPKMIDPCRMKVAPYDKFKLAELALSHPQGLHDVFSALPFKVDLSFKL